MTWAIIDDGMAFHHKVIEAGNAAFGAWCRMLCEARKHKTDGVVFASVASLIASPEEIERLVLVRLLDRDENGLLRIHDFLDHNFSARELRSKNEAKSEHRVKAGRKGGLRSGQVREAKTKQNEAKANQFASQETKQNEARSVSAPSPLRLRSAPIEREGSRAPSMPELAPPEDLHLSVRVIADCEMAGARKPTAADVVAMRAYYAENGRTSANWEQSLIRWMCNAKSLEAKSRASPAANHKGRAIQPTAAEREPFGDRPWET